MTKPEDQAFPDSRTWNGGLTKREYFAAAAVALPIEVLNELRGPNMSSGSPCYKYSRAYACAMFADQIINALNASAPTVKENL